MVRPLGQMYRGIGFSNRIPEDKSQWIVAQWPLSARTMPWVYWFVCPGFAAVVHSIDSENDLVQPRAVFCRQQ